MQAPDEVHFAGGWEDRKWNVFLPRVLEVWSGRSQKREALLWESTKPLVAHPEPHRSLARGGAGFGTLAACTRLPGGHRAKTLTPLSMPAYPAFFLPTPFPKRVHIIIRLFPPESTPWRRSTLSEKKFSPPGASSLRDPMAGPRAQTTEGALTLALARTNLFFQLAAQRLLTEDLPTRPLQTYPRQATHRPGEDRLSHFPEVRPPIPWPLGFGPLGRGGLRTPARKASRQTQMLPRFGHQLVVKPPVPTQCLAIPPAVPCGRAERIPPTKPPFALSRGLPARPSPLGWSTPRRGGLRTPAGKTYA